MNRRRFLQRGSVVAAGLLGSVSSPVLLSAAEKPAKTRIRVVYALHGAQQEGADWPNKGFDFRPHMERINNELAAKCKGFEFLSSLANGPEPAKKILAEDQAAGNIDGYLVYQMNCWNQVVQTFAASGKPVLYADFQFGGSGGFLVYNAAFLRSNTSNVGFVASSRIKDLVDAVKCFSVVKKGGTPREFVTATARLRAERTPGLKKVRLLEDQVRCISTQDCMDQLKASKILAVRGQESGPAGEMMGIQVQHVPFAELNEAWKQADKDQAQAVAEQWTKDARKVEGVSRETLVSSAAMYLGQKALLRKHQAKGITVNCLGGFYGGHIHAYPCLGFHQLLNEGLIGGCECDVRSAATMLVGTTLTQGRPGYISDPVIDSSKRQIIYAHCVASNRAFGPEGEANPFEILTHSEDRQGASVRSHLPVGHLTTTVEFDSSRKELLLHRAVTVANDPDDRACRTKICGEPLGDIEKLFTMWDQWGWHRVTFYGDLRRPMIDLAGALGYKVVEEA
jgi:hypothetical protein